MNYLCITLILAYSIYSAYSSDTPSKNNVLSVSQNANRIRTLEAKLDELQEAISIPDQFEKTCHDCCLGKTKMVSKHLCDEIFPKSWDNENCPCFVQD